MEPVVYEQSPLADYLKDGGRDFDADDWPLADSSPRPSSSSQSDSSAPSSPSPFAPTGRPTVRTRFRARAPSKLQTNVSGASAASAATTLLQSLRRNCSAAVVASIDRTDNAKFLEQFRYIIIASRLLSGTSIPSHRPPAAPSIPHAVHDQDRYQTLSSTEGLVASILGALAVAIVLSWVFGNAPSQVIRRRLVLLLALLAAASFLGQIYMRRSWLRRRREQSLTEIFSFVSTSNDFDGAYEAAMSLVQEVELVSRGYRISTPLPPVSRLEDRNQARKCIRLRKVLKNSFAEVFAAYKQRLDLIKGFAGQTELQKYFDLYDVNDLDISDARQCFSEDEFEDAESLRTLKVLAARFTTMRKMLLCALLALDANGEGSDLLRWTTAVEVLRRVNESTKGVFDKLQIILSETETFPLPPTPKIPLTPGRERWRSQLRKLSSLSTGIRGLQAKLHLLREESDRALDDTNDVSELGPSLITQYESIGADLKELMSAWEEGKAALALGIDRNERRLSSMSSFMSPRSSLSGLTAVSEGSAADALEALMGESSPASPDVSELVEPDSPEIFEAVAQPRSRARPASLLTREERIVKMKEEREQKAQARKQMDATKGMLRELETVINLRPKNRLSSPPSQPSHRLVTP